MHPKFFAALAVTLALFPSMAQAANSPELTYPTGTLLAAKSKIKATSTGYIKLTSGMEFGCFMAEFNGTLTSNNGTTLEADIESSLVTGTTTTHKCIGSNIGEFTWTFGTATNGMPWCLRSTSAMAADEFQLRGGSCTAAQRPIRFVWDTESVGECVYERSGTMIGTFTTAPEDTVLTIAGQEFTRLSGSILCPSNGKLDMTLTVTETSSGAPTYMD